LASWRGVTVGCGYMLCCGLMYVAVPDWLIRPYSLFADPQEFAPTHGTVVVLLRFVALYSFFDAMAIIFGSAIRGAGDTRFSMIFGFLSAWGLLVLPTAFSWWWPGPNLYVCWGICSVYVVALGFGYGARFLQGRWKSMNVIHRGEPEADPTPSEAVALPAVS
jgi:MATE family multidrug resistance protein